MPVTLRLNGSGCKCFLGNLIETAVKEARKDAVMGLIEAAVTEAYGEGE